MISNDSAPDPSDSSSSPLDPSSTHLDLSTDARPRYAEEGFLCIRNFIHGDELEELRANIQRFLDEVLPTLPNDHVFYEDKSNVRSLKQIQHLEDHDPWFHRAFTAGVFRTLAEFLLQEKVTPKNLQYFNKPPGLGAATPPHQDGYYFMLAPCKALTMWLALDHVDEENGCVRYVRGSHRSGMRSHSRTTTLGFSQGIADYPSSGDLDKEVTAPASPGDLLVHDAMTIHRADANVSTTRHRRAIGLIYYAASAKEDAARHQAYQQQLASEMKKVGKL